ncbi:MAG: transposase family protein [Burkholderiales bacterium]|nr:transposase family protein [Burkholderiales bacterium]
MGDSRGFRSTREGYSAEHPRPKKVFVRPLQADAREVLSAPLLDPAYRIGAPKMMLSAQQMRSLPTFFADIEDPRRTQGRRHRLVTILSLAAAAVLCGLRGYKAITAWAQDLSPAARERFGCRLDKGRRLVPSEYVIRNALIRVDPQALDRALQRWNDTYGQHDQSLAIDGKTMCNAIDDNGEQTHIMSVVGHQSRACYTQKKWVPCP